MKTKEKNFPTRIGTVVQAEKIPSITGARDIGGAVVTRTGRVVIVAGISDGNLNYPLKIVVTDDGGKTFREVFAMPATDTVTYHTLGISYDHERDVLVTMFGRMDGYLLLDRDRGKMLPYSVERSGNNDSVIAMSWDNGENWVMDKVVRVPQPENCHGMEGAGVYVGDTLFFPHGVGTGNPEMTHLRGTVLLSRLRIIAQDNGGFTTEYEPRFRVLSSNRDEDILFSCETVYLEKLDGTGYLSFTRNAAGPPYRRQYDLDHRPACEFERCKTCGFDPSDYDHGHNGPRLIAFGITRLADGNLLYASRYYGTDHHRAGNIFMTSIDEGKTWEFHDDHVPKNLAPLSFSNTGGGGNPQMSYAPDGSLFHLTSEGWAGNPPTGGFYLARFQGFTINCEEDNRQQDRGVITIDISTITRIEEVYIAKISISDSIGIEMLDEARERYQFSTDFSSVSFSYRKTAASAYFCPCIVLANRSNAYRPVFTPRIEL